MKIVQITTDNRNQFGHHTLKQPYFGTAPTGLLDGFAEIPEVEVHVVSCTSVEMVTPEKLAENIWFHQPFVSKIGWGKTLFQGCVRAVRALVAEIDPDIVHGQGTERDCAMAAVLSGYPNVLTIHGNMRVHATRGENSKSIYYKLAAMLEGYCLKRTSGVVAISTYTEDLVKDLATKTWLLPNAVDRRYFDITPAPPVAPRILFVGSIDERKNPLGLIRACESMLRAGECTLAIAGQGNLANAYVRAVHAIAESMPGIELLGFIGRDELGNQFGKSSVVVLPTFEDNCPMVVLEAMAAGLPVAASRVGGVPDLITDEFDGVMFDPNSPLGMMACLERLVRDPKLLSDLGAQGRHTAHSKFHPRVIAQEHVRIYKDLLGI